MLTPEDYPAVPEEPAPITVEKLAEFARLLRDRPFQPWTGPIYMSRSQFNRCTAEWGEDTTQWALRSNAPWLTGIPIYIVEPAVIHYPWWRIIARLRQWWRLRHDDTPSVQMRSSYPSMTIVDELLGD